MVGVAVATGLAAIGAGLGPAIGVIVQARLAKQSGKSVASAGPIRWFSQKVFRFFLNWFPWILLLISGYSLVQELRSGEPIDRSAVFRISVWVSTINVNLTMLIVERSLNKVWETIDDLLKIISKTVEASKMHAETTSMMSKAIFGEKEPSKKPRSKSAK